MDQCTWFQGYVRTRLLPLKIWKGRLISSIFLICSGKEDSFNQPRTFCLTNLSLSLFPNPHSSERRKGPKQWHVWSLPGKEGDLGLKCVSTDKVGNEHFHVLRNLQFLLQDSQTVLFQILAERYLLITLRYSKKWCHGLELLSVCFTAVKPSSTKECRIVSFFCCKIERLEKQVMKSSKNKGRLKKDCWLCVKQISFGYFTQPLNHVWSAHYLSEIMDLYLLGETHSWIPAVGDIFWSEVHLRKRNMALVIIYN